MPQQNKSKQRKKRKIKTRDMVFICSPLHNNYEANIAKAKGYCKIAVKKGKIPIAPHIYFTQFMDDANPKDRKQAIEFNKTLLLHCKELWVFGDAITQGMKTEISFFRKTKKPIRNLFKQSHAKMLLIQNDK